MVSPAPPETTGLLCMYTLNENRNILMVVSKLFFFTFCYNYPPYDVRRDYRSVIVDMTSDNDWYSFSNERTTVRRKFWLSTHLPVEILDLWFSNWIVVDLFRTYDGPIERNFLDDQGFRDFIQLLMPVFSWSIIIRAYDCRTEIWAFYASKDLETLYNF